MKIESETTLRICRRIAKETGSLLMDTRKAFYEFNGDEEKIKEYLWNNSGAKALVNHSPISDTVPYEPPKLIQPGPFKLKDDEKVMRCNRE